MAERSDTSRAPDAALVLPPGAPTWVTAALIQRTIAVWQPYYKEALTVEDALAMILTTSRLLQQA
jgi:hypothetical protein